MKILYYAKTDVGIVRKENQDAYGINAVKNYFVVCDGMGGAIAGGFASKLAIEVILKSFENLSEQQVKSITGNNNDTITEHLYPIASIMLANRVLNNLALKYPKLKGMGTTVVAARFEAKTGLLHTYHTGDSRLYRIRSEIINILTKDHSKVNELIDIGKMQRDEIKNVEIQSMITRALGMDTTVEIDYTAYVTAPGDYYIMCSDGLNGEVDDTDIKNIVNKNRSDLSVITNELINYANNVGGRDNITVISFKIEDDISPFKKPDNYTEKTLTISDAISQQRLAEDKILLKLYKKFNILIPKEAKESHFFSNPIIIAFFIVCISLSIVFIFLHYKKEVQKNFTELAGDISGIELNIREIKKERLNLIVSSQDRSTKLNLLYDTIRNQDKYTAALPNVQIYIKEVIGTIKFVGVSGIYHMEIKLPKGTYIMTLMRSGYKILDKNYNLVDSIDLLIETSYSLKQENVIMLPDTIEV